MLEVRYSPKSGVDVSGSLEDFTALRQQLMSQNGAGLLIIEANMHCDAGAYASVVNRIVYKPTDSLVKLSVINGSELLISGGLAGLEMLLSFIDLPARPSSGWHSHLEHYEGNLWVDPESEPVVFSLKPDH